MMSKFWWGQNENESKVTWMSWLGQGCKCLKIRVKWASGTWSASQSGDDVSFTSPRLIGGENF
jgi:hypothetical protein